METQANELSLDGVSLSPRSDRKLLPARAFTSRAFFEAELEHVFERSWVHVADLCELRRPGDYVTGSIGRVPVLIVRDEQGELRGFVNACAHRGATLAEGSGNCGKHLRCPYHAWTYTTDGRLTGVPYRDEFRGLLDGLSLRPIRVAALGPLVFGCVDERAPEFSEWASPVYEQLANIDGAALEPAFQASYEVPVNWKVYVENALDGYHIQFVHDVLPGILSRLFEGQSGKGRYASKSHVPVDMSMLGTLLAPADRVIAENSFCFGNVLPNLIPVVSPFEFTYLRIDPIAVDRIRLVGRSFDRGGSAIPMREFRRSTFERTNEQDIPVVTRVQRGLSGNRVSPSVYAENLEGRIGHFEQMVVRELALGLAQAGRDDEGLLALGRRPEAVRPLTGSCAEH